MPRCSAAIQAGALKVIALVKANPGIDRAGIAQALGMSVRSSYDHTLCAKDTGEIVAVRVACRVVGWFPSSMRAKAKRMAAQQAAERRSEKNARKWAAEKIRRAKLADAEDVAGEMVDQRVVPANAAGPLPWMVRAPNSVFAWRPA